MENDFAYMDILKTLADETRMAILQSLRSGPLTVGDIEKVTGKSHSTTSQQLKRMLEAKLLTARKEATQKFYRIRSGRFLCGDRLSPCDQRLHGPGRRYGQRLKLQAQ